MLVDTLMRTSAVKQATGYSRSTIYALMKKGLFPKPFTLAGGGAVAWKSNDIQRWIDQQTRSGDVK